MIPRHRGYNTSASPGTLSGTLGQRPSLPLDLAAGPVTTSTIEVSIRLTVLTVDGLQYSTFGRGQGLARPNILVLLISLPAGLTA